MEISKIDQKNINNDENLPLATPTPNFTQGGGGPLSFSPKNPIWKGIPPPFR